MARKHRLNVYFDPTITRALDEHAAQRRLSKSSIVEAAVASFLSPDATDRQEAALVRRLDRLDRRLDRLERDQTMTLEAVGLFVRAWLTATPPLPDSAHSAAQAKGRERYASFVGSLGRRMQAGKGLAKEVLAEQQVSADGEQAI